METTRLSECDSRKCVFNEEDLNLSFYSCTRKWISLDSDSKCRDELLVDCATRGGHRFHYTNKNGSRICVICDAVEIEEKVDYE